MDAPPAALFSPGDAVKTTVSLVGKDPETKTGLVVSCSHEALGWLYTIKLDGSGETL